MKRVRRPPTIEGVSVDEFIRQNPDPIFLHREEMWEYLPPNDIGAESPESPMSDDRRDQISFITTEATDDLIVAYAIPLDEPGHVASLILQLTPKYLFLLPPEERGVIVSHELHETADRDLLRSVTIKGPDVVIETTSRTYQLDISGVDQEDTVAAIAVLRQMRPYGGFALQIS